MFEVERVLAAGSQMKENGEIQSLTLYYFVLGVVGSVNFTHKNLAALLQGFAEQDDEVINDWI